MVHISDSNRIFLLFSLILSATLLFTSCRQPSDNSKRTDLFPSLAGAWKEKLQFQTGAFAEIKDLEFMYVFNAGGTMTESSNYDAAPPVPPAYGIWKHVGGNEYEAKYEFYITRISSPAESTSSSGGWLPAGFQPDAVDDAFSLAIPAACSLCPYGRGCIGKRPLRRRFQRNQEHGKLRQRQPEC